MSTFPADPFALAAASIVVKATALFAIAALAQALLRKPASAASRHVIWTLAIAAVLLLPAASLVLPQWEIAVITARNAAAPPVSADRAPLAAEAAGGGAPVAAIAFSSEAAPRPARVDGLSWAAVAARLYVAGVAAAIFCFGAQRWRDRRLARRATRVPEGEWTDLLAACARVMRVRQVVTLLRSLEHSVPVVRGWRRPAIVMPAIADSWSHDRRRAVMLHELAHVARYDCLTQTLALAACALYWFHPAAWWVARRVRIERELACDDRAIAAGAAARDYAGHLLEIAYSLGGGQAPALAVGMAGPHHLEGRLRAALDGGRARHLPTWAFRVGGASIAAIVLLVLAAMTPAVVAADRRDTDSTAASAVSPQPASRVGPELHAIEWPVPGPIRHIVRAVTSLVGAVQAKLPGTWELRPATSEGVVRLRLNELNSSSESSVPIGQLEGLTAAQLAGAGGPIEFRLRRDAGTFTFEGVVRSGVGGGTFAFSPDPKFPEELTRRGFARPTAGEQYQMARHDIGLAFVDELSRQGYAKPPVGELVRAGQHGVQAAYLREMGELGYRLGSLAPLIELRDHGVTAAYVRALGDLGYQGLPADELRRARDHGVSAEYARGMRDAGFGSLPIADLITARDHGVTPEYARELRDLGHGSIPLEELIRTRDHGVSAEYVREMKALGYAPAVADLIRARDHGVSAEFAREVAAAGYRALPLDALIRLRDHGVTPGYARDLQALGYDRLTVDDLVMLRDHGLSVDRIRAANARAGTRLPVDMLRSLAR